MPRRSIIALDEAFGVAKHRCDPGTMTLAGGALALPTLRRSIAEGRRQRAFAAGDR